MSETKNKGGRPKLYKPEYAELCRKMALLGLIDTEIAEVLNVSIAKFHAWKKEYPEFLDAIQKGKAIADSNVADALYQRACGYSHDDVHITNYQGEITQTPIIKHYPPDTGAAFIWLKNRQSKLWRDRAPDSRPSELDVAQALNKIADKLPD